MPAVKRRPARKGRKQTQTVSDSNISYVAKKLEAVMALMEPVIQAAQEAEDAGEDDPNRVRRFVIVASAARFAEKQLAGLAALIPENVEDLKVEDVMLRDAILMAAAYASGIGASASLYAIFHGEPVSVMEKINTESLPIATQALSREAFRIFGTMERFTQWWMRLVHPDAPESRVRAAESDTA